MVAQDRAGPQLPLALRHSPDQRFEGWVGAPAVLAQLQATAAGESSDSLYLQGGSGSGKTHLLLAACAAAALDDLDALAGNRDDEIALFDLHNRVRDAGVALAYAARALPGALPLQLPDLRSRLAHCTLLALRALDDAGRAQVLRQRAASRGLQFDEAAPEWLLTRCSRDLSDLAALFERLDHAALAAQRRLTVPFLRQVLGA